MINFHVFNPGKYAGEIYGMQNMRGDMFLVL